jgi:hypothetical protein
MLRSIPLAVVLAVAGPSPALAQIPQAQSALTHIELVVESTNGLWTPTGLTAEPGDILITNAEGMIRIGPYVDEVDADGAAGMAYAGALEFKIETGPARRIGAAACLVADQRGEVYLRVFDRRRDDNAGSYTVRVLHVPAGAVPPPRPVGR